MCAVDLSVIARALGSIPSTTTEKNKAVICWVGILLGFISITWPSTCLFVSGLRNFSLLSFLRFFNSDLYQLGTEA